MHLASGRPWRLIALELAVEHDPYRILELCEELTTAEAAQRLTTIGQRTQNSHASTVANGSTNTPVTH